MTPARRIGLVLVLLWFVASGLGHFIVNDIEVEGLPGWVPMPQAVVLAVGLLELVCAVGLLRRRTRRAAGRGLIALTLLVTPAHYYLVQNPILSELPYWLLIARLPFQALLIVLIYWTTSRVGRRRRGYRRV